MKKRISLLLVFAMILSFVPVAFAAEEATELVSVTNESVTAEGYTFEHTFESAGVMNVSVGTCSPGWRYRIYYPDGTETIYRTKWSAGASCNYDVTAGTYKIVFYAYSSAEADNVAGTVSFKVTFAAAEGEVEVQKAEYEVAQQELALGQNNMTMLDTAVTTIFVFEPSETAVFTFTAPEGAILGYWGAGSWFLSDPKSTTNTCEWTCTGVGQTAYIGVSGVEGNVNITVEKTGDYEVVVIPIVPYENKAELAPWEKPEGATWGSYVDVMDKNVTHTAVLGDDGYYHLDSVDGDVLVVNLKYQDIILSAALNSDRPVMYAYMEDENGQTVKYDIGNAIKEYEAVMDANGYYPLTEDLLVFYQVYAMGAGTFTYHLTGMNYNEECVWMYCMRTMNMDNVVTPEPPAPTVPTEPSQPESSEPEVSEPTTPSEPEPTTPSEPEPSVPTEPTEPVAGEVVVNEVATADSGSKKMYKFTPEKDGTLTVTVGDGTTNWVSDVYNASAFKVVTSSSGKDAGTYTAELTAGKNYYVRVYASSGALAATPVYAVFTPAGGAEPEPSEPTEPSVPETEPTEPSVPTEPSEPETEPTEPSEPEPSVPTEPSEPSVPTGTVTVADVKDAAVTTTGYVVEYKNAPAGTLHVSVGACTPGWRYKVFSPDGVESGYRSKYTAGTECDYKNVAGNWKIVFYAYSSAEADNVDGTVNFTVTFTPDATQPEEPEIQKDPYKVSASKLRVGTNNVAMEETAEATVYEFKPTETGKYTITGPTGSKIGIWGYSTAYIYNPNSTSNSFEWECTGVGQSIFVGVLGAEGQIVINVEKTVVEPEPTDPPETEPTEPSEPETEPTVPAPSVPEIGDEDVPSDAYYSITVNGTTTYYTSSNAATMNSALGKITGEGYLKFYQDMTLSNGYTVDIYNGNVIVDLNGCTITANFGGAGALYVDGGTVTLVDTSAEGDGVIQNSNKTGHGIELYKTNASSVTMLSGNVIGGTNGQGVKVWSGSSFTMYGGYVVGASYGVNVLSNGSATIYGGTLENTKTSLAYPLYAASTTTVSISGGYFKGGAVSGAGLNGAISGGYFTTSFSTNYLAADCQLMDNADETYKYKVFNPNAQPEQPEEPEPVYVAQVGTTQYTSVTEAAAAAGNQVVVLLMDCADATINSDVTIDLSGYALTNVNVTNGTLYLIDSTATYEGVKGSAAVTGNVASFVNCNGKDYLVVAENGVYSAHCYAVKLTHVSLDATNDALGYKAEFFGDEVAKSHVKSIGFNLWVTEGRVITRTVEGKTEATLRLKNIMAVGGGEMDVNGNAFVVFDVEDKTVTSESYGTSMKETLQNVDAAWSGYTQTQKNAVVALCQKFYNVVENWKLDNIFPIIDVPIQ